MTQKESKILSLEARSFAESQETYSRPSTPTNNRKCLCQHIANICQKRKLAMDTMEEQYFYGVGGKGNRECLLKNSVDIRKLKLLRSVSSVDSDYSFDNYDLEDPVFDAEEFLEELGFAGNCAPAIPNRFIPSLIQRISTFSDETVKNLDIRILQFFGALKRKEAKQKLFRNFSDDEVIGLKNSNTLFPNKNCNDLLSERSLSFDLRRFQSSPNLFSNEKIPVKRIQREVSRKIEDSRDRPLNPVFHSIPTVEVFHEKSSNEINQSSRISNEPERKVFHVDEMAFHSVSERESSCEETYENFGRKSAVKDFSDSAANVNDHDSTDDLKAVEMIQFNLNEKLNFPKELSSDVYITDERVDSSILPRKNSCRRCSSLDLESEIMLFNSTTITSPTQTCRTHAQQETSELNSCEKVIGSGNRNCHVSPTERMLGKESPHENANGALANSQILEPLIEMQKNDVEGKVIIRSPASRKMSYLRKMWVTSPCFHSSVNDGNTSSEGKSIVSKENTDIVKSAADMESGYSSEATASSEIVQTDSNSFASESENILHNIESLSSRSIEKNGDGQPALEMCHRNEGVCEPSISGAVEKLLCNQDRDELLSSYEKNVSSLGQKIQEKCDLAVEKDEQLFSSNDPYFVPSEENLFESMRNEVDEETSVLIEKFDDIPYDEFSAENIGLQNSTCKEKDKYFRNNQFNGGAVITKTLLNEKDEKYFCYNCSGTISDLSCSDPVQNFRCEEVAEKINPSTLVQIAFQNIKKNDFILKKFWSLFSMAKNLINDSYQTPSTTVIKKSSHASDVLGAEKTDHLFCDILENCSGLIRQIEVLDENSNHVNGVAAGSKDFFNFNSFSKPQMTHFPENETLKSFVMKNVVQPETNSHGLDYENSCHDLHRLNEHKSSFTIPFVRESNSFLKEIDKDSRISPFPNIPQEVCHKKRTFGVVSSPSDKPRHSLCKENELISGSENNVRRLDKRRFGDIRAPLKEGNSCEVLNAKYYENVPERTPSYSTRRITSLSLPHITSIHAGYTQESVGIRTLPTISKHGFSVKCYPFSTIVHENSCSPHHVETKSMEDSKLFGRTSFFKFDRDFGASEKQMNRIIRSLPPTPLTSSNKENVAYENGSVCAMTTTETPVSQIQEFGDENSCDWKRCFKYRSANSLTVEDADHDENCLDTSDCSSQFDALSSKRDSVNENNFATPYSQSLTELENSCTPSEKIFTRQMKKSVQIQTESANSNSKYLVSSFVLRNPCPSNKSNLWDHASNEYEGYDRDGDLSSKKMDLRSEKILSSVDQENKSDIDMEHCNKFQKNEKEQTLKSLKPNSSSPSTDCSKIIPEKANSARKETSKGSYFLEEHSPNAGKHKSSITKREVALEGDIRSFSKVIAGIRRIAPWWSKNQNFVENAPSVKRSKTKHSKSCDVMTQDYHRPKTRLLVSDDDMFDEKQSFDNSQHNPSDNLSHWRIPDKAVNSTFTSNYSLEKPFSNQTTFKVDGINPMEGDIPKIQNLQKIFTSGVRIFVNATDERVKSCDHPQNLYFSSVYLRINEEERPEGIQNNGTPLKEVKIEKKKGRNTTSDPPVNHPKSLQKQNSYQKASKDLEELRIAIQKAKETRVSASNELQLLQKILLRNRPEKKAVLNLSPSIADFKENSSKEGPSKKNSAEVDICQRLSDALSELRVSREREANALDQVRLLQSGLMDLQHDKSRMQEALAELQEKSQKDEIECKHSIKENTQKVKEEIEQEWQEKVMSLEEQLKKKQAELLKVKNENVILREQLEVRTLGSPICQCGKKENHNLSQINGICDEDDKAVNLHTKSGNPTKETSLDCDRLQSQLMDVEQKADQLNLLLNQKLIELNKLQLTLSKQTKEMIYLERAYFQLRCHLSKRGNKNFSSQFSSCKILPA